MKRIYFIPVILLALLTMASAQYKFISIECPGMHVLYLGGINNGGTAMVGGYNTDADPTWHTLLIKNGKCIPVAPQTVLGTGFSMGFSMNERGDIAGDYSDGAYGSASHGYLLDKNGVLTTIDFPTADSTIVMSINNSGTVVGQWAIVDAQGNAVSTDGFIWKDGVFTDVAMPGAPLTVLGGINQRGEYTGWQAPDMLYWVMHGFVFSGGQYTPFDVPGAVGTQISGMNDRGHISGNYWGEDGLSHGFVKIGPELRLVDYPGAMMTAVQSLNNSGQLVGYYFNSDGSIHAFLAAKAKK